MKPSKRIYNLQTLVSVKVFIKQKNENWKWHSEGRFLWLFKQKAGWEHVSSLYNERYTQQEFLNKYPNFLVEDGCLYYKPYVELSFVNGEKYIERFLDYLEALEWAEKQVKQGITTKLEINE